ncbi:MAG: 50S ribosomal protein L9 [Dehalococcoidia bacterium]
MKVVFVESIPGVAKVGEVKEVAKGHARNYLLPRGLAVPATSEELKRVEARKRAEEKRIAEQVAQAQDVAGTIDGASLTFSKRVTSKGNIYGSVSSTAIQQELKRLGHDIEKSMIKLESPLRQLGDHEVEVELARDVIARIKVTIQAAEEDKETNQQSGQEESQQQAIDDSTESTSDEPSVKDE